MSVAEVLQAKREKVPLDFRALDLLGGWMSDVNSKTFLPQWLSDSSPCNARLAHSYFS